jgi:mannose-1-phosphate guanylyltransferase
MEDPPLGTAGAVRNAQRYLDDTFFVLNGDIFADLDLSAMLQFHREKGGLATIALTPVEDPSPYGVVESNEQDKVLRFVEKPKREEAPSNMINAGVYVLESDVLKYIPQNTFFMFEHNLFPSLLERDEQIYGYPSSGYWIDMGTPEKYFQLHRDLLAGKSTRISHHDIEKGKASIHPTAHIGGTVVMDEGCTIRRNARIKGPVTVGRGCQIGEEAAIEDSVLWQGVHLGRHATLRSCIVGSNCSIGDEVMLTNSIIGDGAVIASGTKMEPNAKIPPGIKIKKPLE